MALDDTIWGTESVTAAKLNALSLFSFTNVAALPSSNFDIGAKALVESTGAIYQNTGTYAVPVWTKYIGSNSNTGIVIIPHSTTIGDYDTPTGAVATSGAGSLVSQLSSNTNQNLNGGGVTRTGMKLNASSALIGKTPDTIDWWLYQSSTPSGNVTFTIRNSSDTIRETSTTVIDSTTLTTNTAGQLISAQFSGTTTLASGDRISVEYSGANYVRVLRQGTDIYDGGNTTRTEYNAGWTDLPLEDLKFQVREYGQLEVIDDDTATKWISDSENNPAIYVDTGSLQNIYGVAIYPEASTTETEIKIRVSQDTTFSDTETVRTITYSNLTEGAWNYIRFNGAYGRYVQIYGTGSSKILSINEIKTQTATDSEVMRDFGMYEIDSTSTSIGLDGL